MFRFEDTPRRLIEEFNIEQEVGLSSSRKRKASSSTNKHYPSC